MKLVLTQPSPWPVHHLEEGPVDTTDDPMILIGPLEIAMTQWGAWMNRVVSLERPAFTTAEIVRHSPIHSTFRWKVEMVESRITDGNELVEQRLSYLNFRLDWSAPVVFCASPARFTAELKRALPIRASGRPAWRDGVVALADLYGE